MGTLRWEKENAILQEKEQVKLDVERKRREIELLEAETQARIEALHQELDSHRAELTALPNEQEQREQIWKRQREATLRQREGGARQDEPLSENNQ